MSHETCLIMSVIIPGFTNVRVFIEFLSWAAYDTVVIVSWYEMLRLVIYYNHVTFWIQWQTPDVYHEISCHTVLTESLSTLCHIQRCRQSNITFNIYLILDNLRCFLALHKRCPVATPTVPSANVGHETLVTERCSPVSTHPNYLPSI